MKLLVTGGTVFVSKYVATYFKEKGHEVFVLNRGTKEQVEGVQVICTDRNNLKDELKGHNFDAVLDVCAYTKNDIENLLNALGNFKDYILISSSAVYPETNSQPFKEEQNTGKNSIWGVYGTNKIQAEEYLLSKVSNSYILRPPYLYGPMQNIYREGFVFECALNNRKFCIPKDGKMKLQFFHVEDLCRVIEKIIEKHPKHHILNVGNSEILDINKFVQLCYEVAGKKLEKAYITDHEEQRDYFSFHEYEYILDITKQSEILDELKDLKEGLRQSYQWYINNKEKVNKKEFIEFIDKNFLL